VNQERARRTVSLSVLVPAYNEEPCLKDFVTKLDRILKDLFTDYEILIVEDHSKDGTAAVADGIARANPRVRVVHNPTNMGLGYNYRKGVRMASKEYFTWFPADSNKDIDSIRQVLQHTGEADIVIPYISNQPDRPLIRRIVSQGYVTGLNILFGLHLKYYNMAILKTAAAKSVRLTTDSFAIQSELLVILLRRGCTYVEVPYFIAIDNETTIFRPRNIFGVIRVVVSLFYRVMIRRKT
jgi:glycosyltransferase involved in cell wall biosynthesis